MQTPEPAPVVVAVNGTAAGLAAARLGAREAVARGRPLRIVHAFSWPGASSDDPPDFARARQVANQMVRDAALTAVRSVPGVRVDRRVLEGSPVRELLRQSRAAELLVLADDGLATLRRLPLESVLVQTVSRARCPVAVARGVRPPAGPLLAAVDGSASSLLAVRVAGAEAVRRGIALELVHVAGDAAAAEHGRRLLAEAAAVVTGIARVRTRLLHGDPAATLVRASRGARMLLIGPRGTESPGLLGLVAAHLLCHGACPTVFVHGSAATAGVPDGKLPTGALIS
ncbi:universal stress protein [Actinoplanes sp. RD1]|uniref:universal stress protein n=1 Tax=Actinoplanes sp. RD1 TaxID=3064538 RepID=UPI0027406B38|nr:universal stress protein [Actinoplanes sp. RD1]